MEKMPAWFRGCYTALFALLPWSIECSFGAWKLNVPAEPLIVVSGIGLGWFVFKNPGALRRIFSGNMLLPISAAWICWLAACAFFSTMPVVSWKYWIVEAGHWWVFAIGLALFPDLWRRAFKWFVVSTAGVVVYALIHHAFYHFRADQALLAPMPFFPENTLYAAVLAMSAIASFAVFPAKGGRAGWMRLILFTGLFFSFCRAAWLSVLIAGAVGLPFIFREKWRWFAFAGICLLVAGFLLRGQMLTRMANDVSMIERLNRYACALRMAYERPRTGFGPGTFQFQYIPYQKPEEMTRISAREPVMERSPRTYGRGGGVHSEYFQALSEAGWPGLVLWMTLTLVVMWTGYKQFFSGKTKENQLLVLALALSLLTFFVHGIVNNMLHDGRVAALVWGSAGFLVSTLSDRSGRGYYFRA